MTSIRQLTKNQQNVIWGLGGGLLVGLLNLPYKSLLTDVPTNPSFISAFSEGLIKAIPFLIFVIVFVPIVEELFFRVFLFRTLRDKINLFWGYAGSTGLFTFLHSVVYTGGLIQNSVGSLFITYVYQENNSKRAIFIMHSMWNLTWYAVVYIFKIQHA